MLNRENLDKLATYLEGLRADYSGFRITTYYSHPDIGLIPPSCYQGYECGSAACAIGHGPAAGIPIRGDATWYGYASRVFGTSETSSDVGRYMFGIGTPDGHLAAAARIRDVLEGRFDPAALDA